MYIEKRINLKKNIYYIIVEVEYKKKDSILTLCLKNYEDDYYAGGDLSILIGEIENKYSSEEIHKYHQDIGYLADILYIYDHIPFISGIRDVYINDDEVLPYAGGYISKLEIDQIIQDYHIPMHDHKEKANIGMINTIS